MITKDNFKELLCYLNFEEQGEQFSKLIRGHKLSVDLKNERFLYPEGIEYGRDTTINFSQNENFVVFECVYHLLSSGYQPEHLKLEPDTPGGHKDKPTYGDILVLDNTKKPYLLIECKTTDTKDSQFDKEWKKMQANGGQLFNYFNTFRSCSWLCLYTSDFSEGKLRQDYHLISMTDNKKYLDAHSHLQSFDSVKANDGGKDDYFKIWKETYQLDTIQHNLFESEVFKIGHRPLTLSDLKKVDTDSIQKKYHQFATIMRQYNISGRENAFDKLVNIFLCKVVDEAKNPDHLNVYWKGAASDDHFSLQDRLQKLYKIGMYEFLGEDVTYIEEQEIENAFHLFKNKKDETKKTILEYFKQLKFYSNNAFAFLDVHNENLFFQNAVILKDVIQMLQDIKLTDEDEQNQFLGDLFEGFLDQGVKQSEGQFFTPMPIVKFLISSLPLKDILDKEQVPRVIDYACGAGHFLTEYASQAKNIVGMYDKAKLKEHYANIYGIEKEYRLSKVAKVSAFMYGQDQINIIYADALAQHNKIKNNSFDVLVANPPYSVKGFLETLSDKDKRTFELYSTELNEDKFSSIELFFIEKAKQLLKSGGIAAIILPSSILTNGKIYIKCRELLLKYFDIIAIVEFGSETFGKTNTTTVTLFLRKRVEKPSLSIHYYNRVSAWFDGQFTEEIEDLFNDFSLLENYCRYCGLDTEDYQLFLKNGVSNIFTCDLFKDYRQEFDKSKELRELKSKKKFKDLSLANREKAIEELFVLYIKNREKEKVYYYILACQNPKDVLVIQSPLKNKDLKEFLGYEWSGKKGNEGIKYLGGQERKDEDDTLSVLRGIQSIQTPLFNPTNLDDNSKLNYYIRQQFLHENSETSLSDSPFITYLPLEDMLDFSQTSFDKAIRINAKKKTELKSKYPIVKLKPYVESLGGLWTGKKGPLKTVKVIRNTNFTMKGELVLDQNVAEIEVEERTFLKRKLKKGDIIIEKSGGSQTQAVGRVVLFNLDTDDDYSYSNFTARLRIVDPTVLLPSYLHIYLNDFYQSGQTFEYQSGASGLKNLDLERYLNQKIPLPPRPIQEKIIAECEKIDQEYETTRMQIEDYRAKIAKIFEDLEVVESSGGGNNLSNLRSLCQFNPSKSELRQLSDDTLVSFVEMASVSNDGYITKTVDRPFGELKKGSYTYFRDNDVIVAKITPCMENGKAAFASGLTSGIGMGSSEFHVFRTDETKLLPAFLFYFLNRASIRALAEQQMTGSSGHRRVPISFYENLDIPLLSITKQKTVIDEIGGYEQIIRTLETNLYEIENKKQTILHSYI